MADTIIGLLNPGEMGAAVGRCLTGAGRTVLWASAGRGAATAARARAAGLTDAGTVAAMAGAADAIVSVCPPHAAMDVAREVAGCRFGGVFVDANAVSPATAREIGSIIARGGGTFVDGGIVGPPPAAAGQTRLYLSGERAPWVAGLFTGTAVDARAVTGPVGAASAVKMAYAAWTKGTAALLLAIRAMARAEGVEDTLLAEWALSQPSLRDRSEQAARSAAAKGWRWIAEMEEIAASMTADGLPPGFHLAAADIYRRSAAGSGEAEDLEAVITALTAAKAPPRLSSGAQKPPPR
jgi:3-hydroxyisobutyrate dehydrogenase-like beta-hydroxyacid dehydrogenase